MKPTPSYAIAALSLVAVLAAQAASAAPLPAVFHPNLKAGDVLVYQTSDQITGSMDHNMEITHTYVIESISNGVITYQDTVSSRDAKNGGPPPHTLRIDDAGVVVSTDARPAKPSRMFMLSAAQFGIPPAGISVGTTWTVGLDESDFGFAPGTATIHVTALDSRNCTLHIDFVGAGNRTIPGMPGEPAREAQFTTKAHAEVRFSDGILQKWTSTSNETQDFSGSSSGHFFRKTTYALIQHRHR